MQGIKLVILLMLLGAASLPVAHADDEKPSFVICRNQKNVRTVHVDKSGDNYLVSYTRNGIDKEVGRGRNRESVLKIMGNIKTNLEKSNWKCKEVSNVTSTVGK